MKKENGQRERLKKHLDKGLQITRLSALTRLGIFELSARLIDLQREGYKIDKRSIIVNNKFGEKTRVMLYWKMKEKP
jgi:hypothetical protein